MHILIQYTYLSVSPLMIKMNINISGLKYTTQSNIHMYLKLKNMFRMASLTNSNTVKGCSTWIIYKDDMQQKKEHEAN